MGKYELEFKKEEFKTERFGKLIDFLSLLVKGGVLLGSLKIIFNGLQLYIGQESALIVDMIKELRLGDVLTTIVAGTFGVLYVKEKKGKQRAIKEKSKYQKELEQSDEFRSSSNLTEIGTTPKDMEE